MNKSGSRTFQHPAGALDLQPRFRLSWLHYA
jgi:hypothetical protein